MLKPNQIPYEVKLRLRNVLSDGETDEAVALAAALDAWPGVDVSGVYYPWIILPLPQEASDE